MLVTQIKIWIIISGENVIKANDNKFKFDYLQ